MDKKNTNKTNSLVITIVVALIVGAVGFLGGMQYQKSQRSTGPFVNGQGRQFVRGASGGQGQGRFGNAVAVRPVSGEVISNDDKSITIKMQDGSTKIVIVSADTKINKSTEANKSDVTQGEQIMAFGTENTDGSVTAQNISIGGGMFGAMRGNQGTSSGQPIPSK